MNDDKFEGGRIFALNIASRFGKKTLETINTFTVDTGIVKREYPQLIEMMLEILVKMNKLSIKPDYWNKLKSYPQLLLD